LKGLCRSGVMVPHHPGWDAAESLNPGLEAKPGIVTVLVPNNMITKIAVSLAVTSFLFILSVFFTYIQA
jgi:hypothetical protein